MTDHRRENWTVVRVRRTTLAAVRATGTTPQDALTEWLRIATMAPSVPMSEFERQRVEQLRGAGPPAQRS